MIIVNDTRETLLPDIIPADWSSWSASKPVIVKHLPSGLTNQSFLLKTNHKLVVLRINSPNSAALDLDRAAEAQALALADEAGLCTPLIYCDPHFHYLVTEFVEGNYWHAEAPHALTHIAQLLRKTHQLSAIDASLNINSKIARYWQSVDPHANFAPRLKQLDEAIKPFITSINNVNSDHCLCHNDLLSSNLIATADGQLFAIDWEYAAMGDAFYDLAVIVAGHDLNGEQQQLLLSEYLGRPASPADARRLLQWQIIYRYLSLLWYAVQVSTKAMTEALATEEIGKQLIILSALIENSATAHAT